VTLAGPLAAAPAHADTCGPVRGFEAVFPVPDSTGVPPEGKVRVRYALGETRSDPIVVRVDGEVVEGVTCPLDDSCPGSASLGNRELTFEPALSFLPQNAEVEATATDADGDAFTWTFETGDARDVDPPTVEPATSIDWQWLGAGPDDDPCGPEGLVRYQITLELPPAEDQVGRENLEYDVFRLNGPGVDGAPVLEGIALDDGSGQSVEARVYLPTSHEYARRLCFSVGVLDLSGNFTSGQNERCVRLEEGPFFRSCAAAPGAPGHAWGILAVAAVATRRRKSR